MSLVCQSDPFQLDLLFLKTVQNLDIELDLIRLTKQCESADPNEFHFNQSDRQSVKTFRA